MRFLLFFFIIFTVLTGCQTVHTNRFSIEISRVALERKKADFYQPRIESPSAGSGFISAEEMFYSGNPSGYRQSFGYANYFLATWPEHPYSAMTANRAAWASLFSLQEIIGDAYNVFNQYDNNMEMFCRTLFYTQASAKYDREQDLYWTKRASWLRLLLNDGRSNMEALYLFLRAQKKAMIDAYNNMDFAYIREALKDFRFLRGRHPTWLPDYIEEVILENETFLEKNTKR